LLLSGGINAAFDNYLPMGQIVAYIPHVDFFLKLLRNTLNTS